MVREHRTLEHTADIGIECRADSLPELMAGLGEALVELVCPPDRVRPVQQVELRVQAEDLEALAVDFLSRLLARLQVDHFMVHSLQVRQAGELALEGVLSGEPYDPGRHEIGEEIKAVTYHQVHVSCRGGEWLGRVFLDL